VNQYLAHMSGKGFQCYWAQSLPSLARQAMMLSKNTKFCP